MKKVGLIHFRGLIDSNQDFFSWKIWQSIILEFLDLSRDFEGNSKQSEENQTEMRKKEKNRYCSTGHRNCSI